MTIYETVSTLKDKSIEGLLNHFNWEVEKLPLVIAENQQATSAVATARRMDDGRIVVFSNCDTGNGVTHALLIRRINHGR